MQAAKVALAVQDGVSIVCATCKHYWAARDRGVPGNTCLSQENCGGPLSGDIFHSYDGPLTDFSRWCFVCGSEAKFGIQVRSHPRIIGVCAEDVKMLADVRPIRWDGAEPLPVLLKNEDGSLTIQQLMGPPKKSLMKAIAEVESYYAEKEGREV